jgi:tetratricopeptide (TPR) repeat protein
VRAFIVRPFGTKEGIDFDRVERELICPALDRLGISGRTSGEITEQGNIRTDMFQRLATADLVVADISIHNANVFYELGLRHALRERMTFLLRSRADEIPFDLKTDRYLAYDSKEPAATLEALVRGLRATVDSGKADSPVFQLLPALASQDPEALLVVPKDFQDDVERACDEKRRGDLALLGEEVSGLGFEWERAGLRLVGRAQFGLKDMHAARRSWERVLRECPGDAEAPRRLGTIYQKLGDLDGSDRMLSRALEGSGLDPEERAEAAALQGSNAKRRWVAEWSHRPEADRRRAALQSPWLRTAIERYALGFSFYLNHFYSGINALALISTLLDLADEMEEEWRDGFPGDERADLELSELRDERARLDGAVSLALRAAEQAGQTDVWYALTLAEHALLTCEPPRAGWVATLYRRALADAPDFACSSASTQLCLYRDLGLRSACVAAALECVEDETRRRAAASGGSDREDGMSQTSGDGSQRSQPARVVLFTGHRLDAQERETPRFPPEAEDRAWEMIRGAVEAELARARGEAGQAGGALVRGISGAASGGDILFLEVCRELEIPCQIYLAKPRDAYVKASVADAGPGWIDRFDRLLAALPHRVLSEEEELPRWLRGASRSDYSVWQRNNLWMLANALESAPDAAHLTLIALWNGEEGDGPGGTGHMVEVARERGARTVILDAGELVDTGG